MLLANKLIKKLPNPRNAKEHYQSFIRKKSRKSVKQSEIVTYQPKTFDTVDIKSFITESSKNFISIIQDHRKGRKSKFS